MRKEERIKYNNGSDGAHLSKYKKEFCDLLVEHMAQGYSFESFGSVAGVGRCTLYVWCDKYTEFRQAKELAQEMALRFFETAVMATATQTNIEDKILKKKFQHKKISTSTMQWFMKTRFASTYADKQTVKIEGGETPVAVSHSHAVNLDALDEKELESLLEISRKIESASAKPRDIEGVKP